MRLDDPAVVAHEYADDERLRLRAAIFTGRTVGTERIAGVGAKVVAIDLSAQMVELARERELAARVRPSGSRSRTARPRTSASSNVETAGDAYAATVAVSLRWAPPSPRKEGAWHRNGARHSVGETA